MPVAAAAAVAVVGCGVRVAHVWGVLARAVVSIAGRGVATVVLAVGLNPPKHSSDLYHIYTREGASPCCVPKNCRWSNVWSTRADRRWPR